MSSDTVVRDPRARVVVTLTRAAAAGVEALVALVDYATSRAAPAADDPLWGRVDGEHLPSWISREQFRDACAAKQIEGAVKVGRAWTAPRVAVEAWALSGAKTAAANDDEELAERALCDAGYTKGATGR